MRSLCALALLLAVSPARAEINLTLRVVSVSNGIRRPVAPGDTLRTGDRLEMLVDVDSPSYVYITQVFPDGTAAVLFPESGDFKVPADTATRVPPEGKWFELDKVTGDEHVVVIASGKPLDEADEEAKRALDDIRKPAAAKAPKAKSAKKKPMVLSLKTRGLMLVGQDADKSMKAKTDEKGVALFRFSFKHVK
jgi:hypothetical protein